MFKVSNKEIFSRFLEGAYERANKVKYSDFKGEALYDPHSEEIFLNKEAMRQRYLDWASDDDDGHLPEWVFAANGNKFHLNIMDALEQAYEDCEGAGDFPDDIIDIEGIERFVDNWNRKQGNVSYDTDYNTVVLLNE